MGPIGGGGLIAVWGFLSGGVCREGVGVDLVVYGVFISGICQRGGVVRNLCRVFYQGVSAAGKEGEIDVRRFEMIDV